MTSNITFRCLARAKSLLPTVIRDSSAVAMTEFALVAPIFLGVGVLGLDTANYVVTHMRVSQIALQVADNASRVGELDVLVSRRVFESDINDVFIGAQHYSDSIDIQQNGRIILSSLEQNDDDGQWVHWQRCFGSKQHTSTFGAAGDGAVLCRRYHLVFELEA